MNDKELVSVLENLSEELREKALAQLPPDHPVHAHFNPQLSDEAKASRKWYVTCVLFIAWWTLTVWRFIFYGIWWVAGKLHDYSYRGAKWCKQRLTN